MEPFAIQDMFGNSVAGIDKTKALEIGTYMEDISAPRVIRFDEFDLQHKTFTLTFDETINGDTVVFKSFSLQSFHSSFGMRVSKFSLTGGKVLSGNHTSLQIQMSDTDILKIKNDQIDFLQKKALGDVPWYENNKLWLATGIVIGFVVSLGSAYAWGQVSD